LELEESLTHLCYLPMGMSGMQLQTKNDRIERSSMRTVILSLRLV
jgi:hypothetical protein